MQCVDLGESFPTSIYLQNLVSIQPRTSLVKFARSPRTDPPGCSWMKHAESIRSLFSFLLRALRMKIFQGVECISCTRNIFLELQAQLHVIGNECSSQEVLWRFHARLKAELAKMQSWVAIANLTTGWHASSAQTSRSGQDHTNVPVLESTLRITSPDTTAYSLSASCCRGVASGSVFFSQIAEQSGAQNAYKTRTALY